ncbi:zinc finger protein 567-like isoform X1 [Anopheles arabiensis]|uniref:Uncharacterized protein n=1 Tax=Anopheles arabiensis TaxID=7173 RepID=A0A1I8JU24_ANOAR|nr:zinc finger protein 567-like isoform X1 [Anopheles arabiensis]
MVHTLRKITNICRLCLCEELDILVPAKNVFDSLLTSEDVERFTSIQIPTDDNVPYVICTDCRNGLRKSAAFRKCCVRNDRLYNQLFSELIVEIRYGTEQQATKTIHHDLESLSGTPISSQLSEPKSAAAKAVRSTKSKRSKPTKATTAPLTTQQDDVSGTQQVQESTLHLDWPYFTKRLCNICGQMVTNLKRHMLSHTKKAMYACPHCTTTLTDGSNLVRHIKSVHKKMTVKTCEICKKGFTYQVTYSQHMLITHGIGEKFECKMCLKQFNGKSTLRDHINRIHSSLRRYECTFCSKQFKTSRDLRHHGRVHSENRPYACSLCPKRFKSSFARNTHQHTHSGVRFSCQHCDKSYPYKCQLSIHMRKLHPESVAENTDGSVGLKIQK